LVFYNRLFETVWLNVLVLWVESKHQKPFDKKLLKLLIRWGKTRLLFFYKIGKSFFSQPVWAFSKEKMLVAKLISERGKRREKNLQKYFWFLLMITLFAATSNINKSNKSIKNIKFWKGLKSFWKSPKFFQTN